jgi:uncharacterized coiled-coil DUF342 family protein
MAYLTEENFRARFQDATRERDRIAALVAPLRNQRDAVVKQMQPLEDKARELHEQIRKIEKDNNLFELTQEIAMISRAIKFKTGPVGT